MPIYRVTVDKEMMTSVRPGRGSASPAPPVALWRSPSVRQKPRGLQEWEPRLMDVCNSGISAYSGGLSLPAADGPRRKTWAQPPGSELHPWCWKETEWHHPQAPQVKARGPATARRCSQWAGQGLSHLLQTERKFWKWGHVCTFLACVSWLGYCFGAWKTW